MTSSPTSTAYSLGVDPNEIRQRVDYLDAAAKQSLESTDALITSMSNSKEKEAKKIAKKVVSGAKQVIDVVEGVAELHPTAKAVVTVFKAIIKLEMDRRENNEQIALICHSMTRLVYVLRYLAKIVQEEDEITSLFGDELAGIESTIKEFGEFSHVYYRYKSSTFRVCFSGSYKERLQGFFSTFSQQKQNLQDLFSARTDVRLYDMQRQLRSLTESSNKILSALGEATVKEQKALQFIHNHGGVENVVHDDVLLSDITKILGEKVNASMKVALREDLDQLLEENVVQFTLKLEGATMQISEEVERSRDAIIRRLDAGPHELIVDQDVQAVWKDSQWRTSVKCRAFVDALHDYFERKFRTNAQSSSVTHPDSWTLEFFSKVKYHPSIGDAIDEDGSGFISVHETNQFLRHTPEGWTTPQWFSFWAVGWLNNNITYHDKIVDTMSAIKKATRSVKSANKDSVNSYMEVLAFVQPIILDSLEVGAMDNYEGESGSSDLDRLQEEYMELEQKHITDNLAKLGYYLEEEATLVAVTKEERIELSVMCLLSLLLEHHLEIINRAKKEEIQEEAVDVMINTLLTVFSSFNVRMMDLIRGWRQQRKDVSLQIQCFAGGLYSGWYEESQRPNNALTRLEKLLDDEESESDSDEENLGGTSPDKIEQLVTRVGSLEDKLSNIERMLETLINSNTHGVSAPHVHEEEAYSVKDDTEQYQARTSPNEERQRNLYDYGDPEDNSQNEGGEYSENYDGQGEGRSSPEYSD